MITTIISFILTGKFIVGAVVGAIFALIIKNNISKENEAKVQDLLDAANAKLKDAEAKAAAAAAGIVKK